MTVNGMTSQQRFLLAQRLHKRAGNFRYVRAQRDGNVQGGAAARVDDRP
jgi:hypothetical protein